jgi:hypothetical protein
MVFAQVALVRPQHSRRASAASLYYRAGRPLHKVGPDNYWLRQREREHNFLYGPYKVHAALSYKFHMDHIIFEAK